MATDTLPVSYTTNVQFLRIAREIAMDLNDIETILKQYQLTPKQWESVQRDPQFLRLLEAEIAAWNAAGNTHERTKLKAGALIEEWLLEANQRIHDKNEALSAKTEVVKLLARVAGMGQERTDGTSAGGDRFQVTINLGAEKSLKFSKVTPKVIDGTAVAINDEAEDDQGPIGDEED